METLKPITHSSNLIIFWNKEKNLQQFPMRSFTYFSSWLALHDLGCKIFVTNWIPILFAIHIQAPRNIFTIFRSVSTTDRGPIALVSTIKIMDFANFEKFKDIQLKFAAASHFPAQERNILHRDIHKILRY